MPPPYQQPHWSAFTRIPHLPQGPVGESPAAWVTGLALVGVPNAPRLKSSPLSRWDVLKEAANPAVPELFAYVCAMAWGDQGKGTAGSKSNALSAWADAARLQTNLAALRTGGLDRMQAYSLFEGKGKIPGLGPSYFTKLLFFFSLNVPTGQQPYIVDNVILNSMALLTGLPFHRYATRGGYQACCEEMDAMGALLTIAPQFVEERLFSSERAAWRVYVSRNKPDLPACTGRAAYRDAMHQGYPHIPKANF